MSQTGGKKTRAARILGIDTSTLYRKLDRYNLKDIPESIDGDDDDDDN